MVCCCVIGCKQERYPGCGVYYHSIPKNEELAEEWKKVVPGKIAKSSIICNKHFKDEDFINQSRKKLKANAIPSIFPTLFPAEKSMCAGPCSVEPQIDQKWKQYISGTLQQTSVVYIKHIEDEDLMDQRKNLKTDDNDDDDTDETASPTFPTVSKNLRTNDNDEDTDNDETASPIFPTVIKNLRTDNNDDDTDNDETASPIYPTFFPVDMSNCEELPSFEPHVKQEITLEKSTQTDNTNLARNQELARKIKILSQRLKRRNTRICKLKSFIAVMKKKCQNYSEIGEMIKLSFPNIEEAMDAMKSSQKKKKRK